MAEAVEDGMSLLILYIRDVWMNNWWHFKISERAKKWIWNVMSIKNRSKRRKTNAFLWKMYQTGKSKRVTRDNKNKEVRIEIKKWEYE